METTRPCSCCKKEFPRTAEYFYRNRQRKDGLHCQCKKCHIAASVKSAKKTCIQSEKTAYLKQWYRNNRQELLMHYSNGSMSCACCGDNHYEFLTIDHMNGGGNAHRKQFGSDRRGVHRQLKKEGYPPGYQVLCHNCNSAKAIYGECPHERERREQKAAG